jgi:hypothetical protein
MKNGQSNNFMNFSSFLANGNFVGVEPEKKGYLGIAIGLSKPLKMLIF